MRENVTDLAYGDDIAAVLCSKIENGLVGRGHRIVATVVSPEIVGSRSTEWPGNHPADLERFQKLAGDLANRIKPPQPKFLLVCRDLEHAVGRGVANRLSRTNVIVAEACDDLGPGGMAVAEDAWKAGTFA